jgi:hypothetical protein
MAEGHRAEVENIGKIFARWISGCRGWNSVEVEEL